MFIKDSFPVGVGRAFRCDISVHNPSVVSPERYYSPFAAAPIASLVWRVSNIPTDMMTDYCIAQGVSESARLAAQNFKRPCCCSRRATL